MSIVTLVIILVTSFISYKGFNNLSFFNEYKFQIKSLHNKDYKRHLTSGFLHVDFNHLLFNMLTLYFFSPVIINYFGFISFIIIYILSIVVGNLLTFYYHKDNHFYSAVGASGGVSGILFSAILLHPTMSLYIMFIPIPIPAYIVGIGYLGYTVLGMKKHIGNIGHSAHLGGAISGLLISVLINPSLIENRFYTLVLLAIPIVLFLIVGGGKKR